MPERVGESGEALHSTLVLMPAFNESQVIGSVIREVQEACACPVVVIDDASTDDTIARAEAAGATVIPLPAQLGAWGATQTGLRYALRHGYSTVISMDADGQHEAEFLQDLLRPVREGEADVAIGACTRRGSLLRRFAEEGRFMQPGSRKKVVAAISAVMQFIQEDEALVATAAAAPAPPVQSFSPWGVAGRQDAEGNFIHIVSPDLQEALDRVSEAGIPRDIVFNQGTEALGL